MTVLLFATAAAAVTEAVTVCLTVCFCVTVFVFAFLIFSAFNCDSASFNAAKSPPNCAADAPAPNPNPAAFAPLLLFLFLCLVSKSFPTLPRRTYSNWFACKLSQHGSHAQVPSITRIDGLNGSTHLCNG